MDWVQPHLGGRHPPFGLGYLVIAHVLACRAHYFACPGRNFVPPARLSQDDQNDHDDQFDNLYQDPHGAQFAC